MRRTYLSIILFTLFILPTTAQRFIDASNINLSGGYNFEKNYIITAGFEKYFGADNSLRVNAQYFNYEDKIESLSTKIDINNILADASLNHYFSVYKRLFFSIGAGGTAGYQFFSFDKPDYVEKTEDNRFVYGFNGVAQLELNFSTISLFTEYKANYLFNSRENFYNNVSLGIKKYF